MERTALTIEQLKEMHGKPILLVAEGCDGEPFEHYDIATKITNCSMETAVGENVSLENYGKTWTAYYASLYEDLNEQGRLLILPIKVGIGDHIYRWVEDDEGCFIGDERIVDIGAKGVWVTALSCGDSADYRYDWDEIGKSVFLSREEVKSLEG